MKWRNKAGKTTSRSQRSAAPTRLVFAVTLQKLAAADRETPQAYKGLQCLEFCTVLRMLM